ncbi:MAG: hypothetical protein CM1200mP6_10500 [Anaerolineaceae bacterium]|nr:MAG: hypothetical protein CM1200mP6_10500 [Anaerolineaceae bacterium]
MNTRQEMLRNTYRIGAKFLHELRTEMGDKKFRSLLANCFVKAFFRVMDGTAFFKILRSHTTEYPEEIISRYFDENIKMPDILPAQLLHIIWLNHLRQLRCRGFMRYRLGILS